MKLKHVILSVLAIGTARSRIVAQSGVAAAPLSSAQCDAIVQVLVSGSLAAVDSQETARAEAAGCSEGPNAVAAAMRRRKDYPLTPHLYRVFSPNIADTSLLAAALELATDGTAGVPVRVMSMRLLLTYMGNMNQGNYESLTGATEGAACLADGWSDPAAAPYRNLPSNVVEQIRQVAKPLERDPNQPAQVRSAANCLMNSWRVIAQLPTQPVAAVTSSSLRVEYICGTRFRIVNRLQASFDAQYRLGSSGVLQPIFVRSRLSGETEGTTILDTRTAGSSVSVLLDGEVVGTAMSTGSRCT